MEIIRNLELIARKRKSFILFNYFWLVSLGGLIFPISFSYPIYLLVLIVGYFFIGFIFLGLYEKRTFVVFLSAFVLNGIGLSWRVFLEWGEFSMTRDLTVTNVGVHLTAIPIYILLVYLVLQKLSSKNIK